MSRWPVGRCEQPVICRISLNQLYYCITVLMCRVTQTTTPVSNTNHLQIEMNLCVFMRLCCFVYSDVCGCGGLTVNRNVYKEKHNFVIVRIDVDVEDTCATSDNNKNAQCLSRYNTKKCQIELNLSELHCTIIFFHHIAVTDS